MGLNPLRYVVVPNVLASLLALPVLTVVFDVIGILGGYLVGVRLLGLNGGTYFGEMSNYVEMKDILGGIYKALTFGLLIGWVCCYKGYHSRFGAEGVSAATTQAVVNASVLILVCGLLRDFGCVLGRRHDPSRRTCGNRLGARRCSAGCRSTFSRGSSRR